MQSSKDDATVFVRNLPLDMLHPELEALFGDVGPVKSASVIFHKKAPGDGGQQSRGFGFVSFAVPQDAVESIKKLHGTIFRGRDLKVELVANKKKGAAAAPSQSQPTSKATNAPAASSTAASDAKIPTKAAKKARAEMMKVSRGEDDESQSDGSGDDSSDDEEKSGSSKPKAEAPAPPSRKAAKIPSKEDIDANTQPAALRTLRVFGLSPATTQKQLLKRIQKMATAEAVELVGGDDSEKSGTRWPNGGMARVVAASVKDAAKVMAKLDRKELHGKVLSVRYEVHVHKRERALLGNQAQDGGLTSAKAGRVIVRNLNFKATAADVAAVFVPFGPITEVHIPTVSMPKHFNPAETRQQSRGFAFVQFLIAHDAAKAVAAAAAEVAKQKKDDKKKKKKEEGDSSDSEEESLKRFVVGGRIVSVALAQSKKDFDAGVPAPTSATTEAASDDDDDDDDDDAGSSSSSSSDGGESSSEDEEDSNESGDEDTEEGDKDGEEDSDESSDDSGSESEDDDDEEVSDDEETDARAAAAASSQQEKQEDGQYGKAEAAAASEPNAKKKRLASSRDVSEGRSVFVKNLSFEATESDLRHRFEPFGAVERAMVVLDKSSGLPRGTAFVTFAAPESALAACASAAKAIGGLTVLGRRVDCLVALDREAAAVSFGKEGRDELKSKRDRRNLYLKDEGLVMGVGDAARKAAGRERHKKKPRHSASEEDDNDDEGGCGHGGGGVAACPASDLAKRQHAHTDKKKKLANPLFFISPLRLSVRNLARKVDDGELRRLFSEAAREGLRRGVVGVADLQAQHDAHASDFDPSDKKSQQQSDKLRKKQLTLPSDKAPVKVVACKVMRDLERPEQPSRGYGFVDFATHAHALAALRWANNNPELSEEAAQGGEGGVRRHRSDQSEWPRLMVEFACENKGKIQVQEKRKEVAGKKMEQQRTLEAAEGFYEDSQPNAKVSGAGNEDGGSSLQVKGKEKKVKQQSRGQKQREKRRRQQEEGQQQDQPEEKEQGAAREAGDEGGGGGGVASSKDNGSSTNSGAGAGAAAAVRQQNKRARRDEEAANAKSAGKGGKVGRCQMRGRAEDNNDGELNVEERLVAQSMKASYSQKAGNEGGGALAAGLEGTTRQQRRKAAKKSAKSAARTVDDIDVLASQRKSKLLGGGSGSDAAKGATKQGGGGSSGDAKAAAAAAQTSGPSLVAKFRESAARWFE